MVGEYQTIEQQSQGEYKDKGSKFIAFAHPIQSEEEVKGIIEGIRKEHLKSRHVCYAYRVGVQAPLERANDDGEPSSTAGKPILGQIHSFGITNVLIGVVRYFGGTLLGVSGLINAYRSAAEDSLQHNKIITKTVNAIYEVKMSYAPFHEVMNYLKNTEIGFLEQEMGQSCRLVVSVSLHKCEEFEENLLNFAEVEYVFLKYE